MTIKNKFNFFKVLDLQPLNTCKKLFKTILVNFSPDKCEFSGIIIFLYVATAITAAVYSQKMSTAKN